MIVSLRRRPCAGKVLPVLGALVAVAIVAAAAFAQQDGIEIRSRCFECHMNPHPPEGARTGPRVDLDGFRASVHGKERCESCHRTVISIPHDKNLPPVECRSCHRVDNQAGAPQLKSYREFENSVHGRLGAAGDPRAPRCQNCHGDHDVLPPAETASHVNKLHIAETCGACHEEIERVYEASAHGRAVVEGDLNAAVCTDCHGEHTIMRHGDAGASVSRSEVVNTCSACHADIERMGMFADRVMNVEQYKSSYHGVAYKLGSEATATCVECHRHHDIRARDDERSSIHPVNLPKTCGPAGCHEGAGPGFARGRVHVDFHRRTEEFEHEGRDRTFARVFHFVELAFIGLTTTVIFFMIIYMAFDLFDKWVRHDGRWVRFVSVTTVPMIITFWLTWKAVNVFLSKLHF